MRGGNGVGPVGPAHPCVLAPCVSAPPTGVLPSLVALPHVFAAPPAGVLQRAVVAAQVLRGDGSGSLSPTCVQAPRESAPPAGVLQEDVDATQVLGEEGRQRRPLAQTRSQSNTSVQAPRVSAPPAGVLHAVIAPPVRSGESLGSLPRSQTASVRAPHTPAPPVGVWQAVAAPLAPTGDTSETTSTDEVDLQHWLQECESLVQLTLDDEAGRDASEDAIRAPPAPPDPPPPPLSGRNLAEFTVPRGSRFRATVVAMIALADRLFPCVGEMPTGAFKLAWDLAERAMLRADRTYGVQAAVDDAADFEPDASLRQRDLNDFIAGGRDLPALMDKRKASLAHNRMSEASVRGTLRRDNPELERLVVMATEGAPVHAVLDEAFVPNGADRSRWPKRTRGYAEAHPAVNKALETTFMAKGLAVVLPAAEVLKIPGANVFASGWTDKPGCVAGRPLGDPRTLNTKRTKLLSDDFHGVIQHPTFIDMAKMVREFHILHPEIPWADIILLKVDIKGAYTLISFASEGGQVFATELTNDEVMFYTCG
ncbi:hypothetical protein B484DRAFT_456496, partial [Ochromonadaceae sp. CCMP2298]